MAKGKTAAAPAPQKSATLATVNAREMARLLGVSAPTISAWVDQGAPCEKRGRPGVSSEFDPVKFIAWWKDTVVLAKAEKPEKLHEREQRVDIELKELKLRQQKAELVPRAIAVHVINSLHTQTAAILRQGPRRFGARFVGLPDMAAAVQVATTIVEEQIADLRLPETWRSIAEEPQPNDPERIEETA